METTLFSDHLLRPPPSSPVKSPPPFSSSSISSVVSLIHLRPDSNQQLRRRRDPDPEASTFFSIAKLHFSVRFTSSILCFFSSTTEISRFHCFLLRVRLRFNLHRHVSSASPPSCSSSLLVPVSGPRRNSTPASSADHGVAGGCSRDAVVTVNRRRSDQPPNPRDTTRLQRKTRFQTRIEDPRPDP